MTVKNFSGFGLVLLLLATPARAENSGAADPGLLLGKIRTFGAEAVARLGCGKDEVVWADRYEGYFYNPREPKYGKTGAGAYACQQDAAAGNYFSTDPLSTMASRPGRNFPFTPIFVGS